MPVSRPMSSKDSWRIEWVRYRIVDYYNEPGVQQKKCISRLTIDYGIALTTVLAVYNIVKNYTTEYDRTLIFNKVSIFFERLSILLSWILLIFFVNENGMKSNFNGRWFYGLEMKHIMEINYFYRWSRPWSLISSLIFDLCRFTTRSISSARVTPSRRSTSTCSVSCIFYSLSSPAWLSHQSKKRKEYIAWIQIRQKFRHLQSFGKLRPVMFQRLRNREFELLNRFSLFFSWKNKLMKRDNSILLKYDRCRFRFLPSSLTSPHFRPDRREHQEGPPGRPQHHGAWPRRQRRPSNEAQDSGGM